MSCHFKIASATTLGEELIRFRSNRLERDQAGVPRQEYCTRLLISLITMQPFQLTGPRDVSHRQLAELACAGHGFKAVTLKFESALTCTGAAVMHYVLKHDRGFSMMFGCQPSVQQDQHVS